MARYEKLIIWQKAVELVKYIYKITESFPKNELFGLTSQIRRAAISIPSNIAEGTGRISKKEFINFLHIALGSLYEVKTQLFIAKELNFIDSIKFANNKIDELEKMIVAMIKTKKDFNDK
ncbi:four helix bundle protein [Nitrosophilus kaiyonis]|uniref:four helix bundle protein n=1 Tax=Nitrosophilus kaiyonis TaxID=2930200 RepID=UPI002492A339|nr:four helix bundle protein [Nitrosophilus kaiyonis]